MTEETEKKVLPFVIPKKAEIAAPPAVPPKIKLNHHKVEVMGFFKNEDKEPAVQELIIKLYDFLKIEDVEATITLQTWDEVSKFGGLTVKKDKRFFFYPLHVFNELECVVNRTVVGTSVVDPPQGGQGGKAI